MTVNELIKYLKKAKTEGLGDEPVCIAYHHEQIHKMEFCEIGDLYGYPQPDRDVPIIAISPVGHVDAAISSARRQKADNIPPR